MCCEARLDREFARKFGIEKLETYAESDTAAAFFNPRHPLNKLVASHDVFHLNGHWKWENFFLSLLARRHGVPYVLHPRGMLLLGHRRVWLKRLYNLLIGNKVVRRAQRVIALSEYEARHFRPYHLRKDRVAVVPNPLQLPARVSAATGKQTRYFLYFGRIEHRKNLLWLVDAFEIFRGQGGQGILRLVGPVEYGYDEIVKKYIADRKLQDVVTLEAPVYGSEKWNLLGNAIAVIYPAREEAFGRVPFEAIAAGSLPIIPQESGCAEYLMHLLPQCVYDRDVPAAMAKVMSALAGADPSALAASQQKAALWVREKLDPAKNAADVYALYEGAIRSTGT